MRHPEGYLFFPNQSKARTGKAGGYSHNALMVRWGDALARARRSGLELPGQFVARRLRASFITVLRGMGVDTDILRKYVGHAPETMLAAHYLMIDLERMRTVAEHAQRLVETHAEKVRAGGRTGTALTSN